MPLSPAAAGDEMADPSRPGTVTRVTNSLHSDSPRVVPRDTSEPRQRVGIGFARSPNPAVPALARKDSVMTLLDRATSFFHRTDDDANLNDNADSQSSRAEVNVADAERWI